MAKVVIPVTADVKEARRELDKIEDKKKQLEARKIKLGLDEEKIRLDLQKIDNDIEILQEKMANKEATSINLGADVEYQGMTRQMDLLLQKGDLYANRLEVVKYEANQTSQEYDKQVQKQQQLGTQIDNNKNKQQDMNNKQKEHSFHLADIIKKVGRWGLAIIGVRSAYSGIRSAISLVSGSNEEVAKKLEQMRNVIAGALTPLVQFIVGLLMKAMVYINYITKALFGKEIFNFSDATKKASNNLGTASKNAKGTAKSLEKAKKQLAGFDEMTTLSDENSSGGGGSLGGAGGVDASVPNYFDKLGEIKIPDWLKNLTKWIKDAIDWFLKLDPVFQKLLIAAGLLIGSYALGKATGLLGIAGILKGLATIGVIAIGVDLMYKALTGRDLLQDIMDIKKALEDLNGANKDVANGTEEATKTQTKYQKEVKKGIKTTDNSTGATDKNTIAVLDNMKRSYELTKGYIDEATQMNFLGGTVDKVTGRTKALSKEKQAQEEVIKSGMSVLGEYRDEIGFNEEQEEAYQLLISDKTPYDMRIRAIDELKSSLATEIREKNNSITVEDRVAKSLGITTKSLQEQIDRGGPMGKLYQKLIEDMKKTGENTDKTKDKIMNMGNIIRDKIKSKSINLTATITVDDIKNNVKNKATSWLKALFGAKGMVIGYAKGGIIPYASGGIINQPGRGVPLPIGGEHGMEGVVPLTDSQQMALLGEAIGKYITINANITNTMNGRVLSRELQKIQNEEAFGSNRW